MAKITMCKGLVSILLFLAVAGQPAAAQQKPNFVFILTDDQDVLMEGASRTYMPKLHELVGDQGLELTNFVVNMAWCCPSRASLLTGRLVHNTNITGSDPPHGGAPKYGQNPDWTRDSLPVWLSNLGYNTYFTGKYLNKMLSRLVTGGPKWCRGWRMFEGQVNDGEGVDKTFREWYERAVFTNNCTSLELITQYYTTTMKQKGQKFIDDAIQQGKPFFIEIAPVAPHDQGDGKEAVPEDKYANIYPDAKFPVSPNWNVNLPKEMNYDDGAPAVELKFSQRKWIQRMRSLKSVDDMVEELIVRLDKEGVLNNTYFIYTSDNGFHLGQHGLKYEKFTPFEEDLRVPFFMRGPGIPAGIKSDLQTTMVDVAATIVSLASGGQTMPQLDGVPLPLDDIAEIATGKRDLHLQQLPNSPPPPKSIRRNRPPPPGKASSNPSPPAATGSATNPGHRRLHQLTEERATIKLGKGAHKMDPMDGSLAGMHMPDMTAHGADHDEAAHGRELLQSGKRTAPGPLRDTVLVEGWLPGEGIYNKNYRTVRVCTQFKLFPQPQSAFPSNQTCYKYTIYAIPPNRFTDDHNDYNYWELYDLGSDQHELNNRHPDPLGKRGRRTPDDASARLWALIDRLDAVLTVMAYCEGIACRNPWRVLHPDGGVSSLADAMDSRLDSTYAGYQKLRLKKYCEYYDPANEQADPTILALLPRLPDSVKYPWLRSEESRRPREDTPRTPPGKQPSNSTQVTPPPAANGTAVANSTLANSTVIVVNGTAANSTAPVINGTTLTPPANTTGNSTNAPGRRP